jgi:predicted transposase YdaD
MFIFDALLKRLVEDGAADFAAWLLGVDVTNVELLPTELSAETIEADVVMQVTLADGRVCLLHIEFQGRRSHRPMPWRMLEYMARLAQKHSLPVHSAVIYFERGAGGADTGQYQYPALDGSPMLTWRYQVIHLWRISAEEALTWGGVACCR